MRKLVPWIVLLLTLLVATPLYAQPEGLSESDLANATYIGIGDEPIQLTDGLYTAEASSETMGQATVEMTGTVVYHDFDGDGVDEAAVLLVEDTEGTGRFYYLAIVKQGEDGPENVATTALGDRLQIEAVEVDENGIIQITMVAPSQFDAACCPTMRVRRAYIVLDSEVRHAFDQLLGATEGDSSPISIEEIANATYTVASHPETEMTFVEGEYRDEANNITATIADGPYFGDLNDDGELDAVIIIDVSGGGSGTWRNVVVILNDEGTPTPVTSLLLGDRAVVNNLSIMDGQLLVDALVSGPDDAACCPTVPLKAAYTLDGSELLEISRNEDISANLTNLAYPLDLVDSGVVTLTDGAFEGDDFQISLSTFVGNGDLNGDGVDDAAAIVTANSTGTGNFYYLYALLDEDGALTPLEPILVDDRAEIHDVYIDNGEIVLEATVHGPDDPACCPTQVVERRYGVQDGAVTLLEEQLMEAVLYGAAGIVPGGTFDPDTDGAAVLNLGGTGSGWLDPSLVSALSGVATGLAVDAQTLGEGCVGYIPERPDVVLNWTEDTDVEALRLFALGFGDPVMVVVTPSGEILCNDDYTPLVPDPFIEIADPEEGRYAIFVGSFEDDAVTPGFVVVSGLDLNPAALDPTQLFPARVDPNAVRTLIGVDAMLVDAPPQDEASEPLNTDSLPFTASITAGGALEAFNVDLGNTQCTGFISAAPSFAFDWEGDAAQITVAFEAAEDTTLIVRDPDGAYHCNDDFGGATNLNPAQSITPVEGSYLVWVGGYAPEVEVEGTLTIAEGDFEPTALTSDSEE